MWEMPRPCQSANSASNAAYKPALAAPLAPWRPRRLAVAQAVARPDHQQGGPTRPKTTANASSSATSSIDETTAATASAPPRWPVANRPAQQPWDAGAAAPRGALRALTSAATDPLVLAKVRRAHRSQAIRCMLVACCCAAPWSGWRRLEVHASSSQQRNATPHAPPSPAATQAWFFLGGASGALLFPYLNIFLAGRGLTPAQIGLISALRPWVAAPASVAVSALADRRRAHGPLLLLGLAASAALRAGLPLAAGAAQLFAVLLAAEAFSFFGVLGDATVLSNLPKDQEVCCVAARGIYPVLCTGF